MNKILLSTGSNVGDRLDNLRRAKAMLVENIGPVLEESHVYESEAWGLEDQRLFLNQVCSIKTSKTPEEVLEQIQNIESKMGRIRTQKWAQRLIDIDILFYEDVVISNKNLKIPHPHLQDRNFVLTPLLEIAPEVVHPKLKCSIKELFMKCTDPLKVGIYP